MRRDSGFTLLELLVVVAILVIVAGGLIAAYDGLETKSAQGVATFNLGALDSSIRTFRATNNGQFPDEMDSMLFSTTGDGTDATPLNILPTNIGGDVGASASAKFGAHTLTPEGAAALRNAGITTTRYVTGAGYTNTLPSAGGTQPTIPNRVFDNPTRGFGVQVAITDGVVLAAVENVAQADFSGATPGDSSRLRDIAGLDETIGHVVVGFGIGNNSTLVQSVDGRTDARAAALSQAPYYKNLPPNQYSRFIALFHLASDTDGTAGIGAADYFGTARFVGVIDTKGDWYEEEEAEYTGVKQ